MTMCKEAIKIQNVTFKYGKKLILDNVNLSIPQGKISLLMGASGSGKSTLVHIASGLLLEEDEKLDSGTITVFEKDISTLANNIRAKYVTVMFQNPDLQFCMDTLRKEMIFCLENINVSMKEMDSKIESTINQLSLNHLLDRKLSTLSGGEKQKAALCCLCVMNSGCLILDEPFANLDRDSALSLVKMLKKLRDESSITIVAVDHQIDYWMGIFDNIILLSDKGKILTQGINESSLKDYKDLFLKEGVFFPENKNLNTISIDSKSSQVNNELGIINVNSLVIFASDKQLKNSKSIFKPKRNNSIDCEDTSNIIINQKGNFSFKEGSITAILGHSGCGKTTFFLSLLKQHKFEGKIEILNKDLNKLKLKEITKLVGIVFQNPINQFVTQNVYDEVAFSIKLWNKKIGETELKNMVISLLDDYGLIEYKNQSPYLLSQGQMRRLAVLSVLAGDQKVLLLDEPTYAQDYKSTKTIMKNLKQKVDNNGLTVIFTTHDRNVASKWANTIYEVENKSFQLCKNISDNNNNV